MSRHWMDITENELHNVAVPFIYLGFRILRIHIDNRDCAETVGIRMEKYGRQGIGYYY